MHGEPIVLLAQTQQGGGGFLGSILYLAILVAVIAGFWQVFTKAGKPGWAALIPIYNGVVMLEIAGRPIWWIVLLLIPPITFVVAIIVSLDVARNFGKGTGFGVGLALLPFVFYPLLGFSDAQYHPMPH